MVDPKKAEPLTIILNGTTGELYKYSIEFTAVEDGKTEHKTFGSAQDPLLIAFDDGGEFNPNAAYYDWNFSSDAWTPAPSQ